MKKFLPSLFWLLWSLAFLPEKAGAIVGSPTQLVDNERVASKKTKIKEPLGGDRRARVAMHWLVLGLIAAALGAINAGSSSGGDIAFGAIGILMILIGCAVSIRAFRRKTNFRNWLLTLIVVGLVAIGLFVPIFGEAIFADP